jgi:alcohol dehydrogenase class IV
MERFYLPTEIITGCGCLKQLGKVASVFGRRAMLVCYANFGQFSDVLPRALGLLQAEGVHVTLYDAVTGEAELPIVQQGIDLARREQCEVFIGLGGGSAIDTAKAIAGMVDLPGHVQEYHQGRKLEGGGLPFIAIPTTAGTGAEVTKNAVLIDPERGIKESIRDDGWFARVALVDPEATLSMPPPVTASTGADALCQAIESYTSIGASPLTDALAIHAIKLIGRSLERAYVNGQDVAAREDMSMGSLMAGMAMVNARLGAVHGMAHPLGSHYRIPHGVVCGLLLPYTMEYNLSHAMTKYAQLAPLLGVQARGLSDEDAAQVVIDRVRQMLEGIAIPMRLAPFGVREEELGPIIEESLTSSSLKHNPRPLNADDVRRILKAAL